MGTHYHARMEAIGAAEQMLALLETPVMSQVKTASEMSIKTIPHQQALTIKFDQVSFSYEQGRQALDTVNIEFKAGQRIALVGASGAGKTTIANLLLGFVQNMQGKITVNGVDLQKLNLAVWREQVAWLPQRPYLFHGTIGDNIRLGNQHASDKEVYKAATLAHCTEFITTLADGYETKIGERGEGLSGGQIQRIALARAFLKNAPLLILDEVSANLDGHSEALIQQSIEALSKGRTVITIAHRLNTIKQSDLIVVMEKGKVLESGSHQQLLAKNKHYTAMLTRFNEDV